MRSGAGLSCCKAAASTKPTLRQVARLTAY
jgi:hypothetical protein